MLAIKFRFDISLRGGKVNLQDPKVEKEKKGVDRKFSKLEGVSPKRAKSRIQRKNEGKTFLGVG